MASDPARSEPISAEVGASYSPPIDALLSRGEEGARNAVWPDYVAELGLGPEHVPELIRMATDDRLNLAPATDPGVWAPLHAWRALGQLRAGAAIEPLLDMLDPAHERHDDMALQEIPLVIGMIGDAAIPALVRYLAEPEHGIWTHMRAAQGLKEIALRAPSTRKDVLRALVDRLERHAEQDPMLNASIVSDLLDLQATEVAPLMERAFAAGDVDIQVAGDWEDVQIQLGLLEERLTPRPRYGQLPGFPDLLEGLQPTHSAQPHRHHEKPNAQAKAKAKRKQAAQARKRNKKRK